MKYVFYHGSCYDGFGSAFSAWKKFGDTAKYIPASYGKTNIFDQDFQPQDEVYILDYSIDNDEFETLVESVSKVVMLDHHKTALERFTNLQPYPETRYELKKDNVYVLFDMEKSGALLTWEYFHPGTWTPNLIKFISDRDLWTFNLPETKAIHALLTSRAMDFEVWDKIRISLTNNNTLVTIGESLMELQDQTVTMICKKAYMTNVAGYTVPAVNSSSHWSEVGNKLLDLYPAAPFALSYCDQPDGMRMMSLRSRAGSDFDVSAIAGLFSGGGHRNASGFRFPVLLHFDQLANPTQAST
jgi:oligoribonuclease NrnB/cAMP/cGMP phosphodiesterase (DHH superfamily)